MAQAISFVVPTSTGEDVVFTVNKDGELGFAGYEERLEYEIAFQAMGGERSQCTRVMDFWNEERRVGVVIQYVLSSWDRNDVITLMLKSIAHTLSVIENNAGDSIIDYNVLRETHDFTLHLYSVVHESETLKYSNLARRSMFRLSNGMFVKGKIASSSFCDAITNAMDWVEDVVQNGWSSMTSGPDVRNITARHTLDNFFGFLAESVNDAMIETNKRGVLYKQLENLWQIRTIIDMAAEIESRKP